MGRLEKSQGLAPPAVRKDIRAKEARHIVNRVIPAILTSNAKARKGVENSSLIVDPPPVTAICNVFAQGSNLGAETAYIKRKGQGRRRVKDGRGIEDTGEVQGSERPGKKNRERTASIIKDISTIRVASTPSPASRKECSTRIIATDTLTAAHMLACPLQYDPSLDMLPKSSKKQRNVCVLNMASPLRPGGGVLSGATSQEEFLCARTTLLPSLKEAYYRLPELGGILTEDVLVFRSSAPLGDDKGELAPRDRWWIDVISAGMLRFPELEGEEDEVRTLSKRDCEVVEAKMRAVLRIAASRGVKKLVLGAWGCGAYGNPVKDIAKAWRKILDGGALGVGTKKEKATMAAEMWPEIEEIVFAIMNGSMANHFAEAFGGHIQVEAGPMTPGGGDGGDDDGEDKVAEELRAKISEIESQVNSVYNPDLKNRMGAILAQLETQLSERAGALEERCEDGCEDIQAENETYSKGEGDGKEEEEEAESESDTEDEEYVVIKETHDR